MLCLTIIITGEFRVAAIFPIFAEVTSDLFTAAAVELINEGVWEPDFKGTYTAISNSLPGITAHMYLYIDYRLRAIHGVSILFCTVC